jgi:Uma2 family endonuclease
MTPEITKPSARPSRHSYPMNGHLPDPLPIVDLSEYITEDDTPVESYYQASQQRLLVEPLRSSWNAPEGRVFLIDADVGVFPKPKQPPIVPDAFLSFDVALGDDLSRKENRSYFVWVYGKPPEVTVEMVSNDEGKEDTEKPIRYAQMGVKYYAIFDPWAFLGPEVLRLYSLEEGTYQRIAGPWLEGVGLGLKLWQGPFEGLNLTWLRWCDEKEIVIPTGAERAAVAESHSAKLAAKLREMGVDPDTA